jgi:hypothetical protein
MTPLEHAKELLKLLPADSSFEDIQYHLDVKAKIAKALEHVEDDRCVTHEEAVRRVRQCLKSSEPFKG